MHPIDKTCVKPLHKDDEGHPLGETVQCIVVIGPDAEGSSSCPGEYVQIVPLALHDYPSYVLRVQFIDTVCTNDNKSRSHPWSGFVAASTTPRLPSTPAHDWIDDYETKATSLSAKVSEAKAVAEGDPMNTAKVLKYHRLAADYAERFGLSEPNTEAPRHILQSCGCLDRDFGYKYEAADEYADRLSMKHKLRDIYKKILDLPEDRCAQLVGQQAFSTSLQNPFPEHDLCNVETLTMGLAVK
ncbi:hypothetical protein DFH08DRAFT_964609 [Mycena albidolilacea]|uniref:Uncharacterized protein n=1 Tax=Mycena albidolilacea TaxID=1033008 RepID=A0AAD6ZTC9_9AGAR|nr:hypothetical protein DFH08DRAFT_964609 [Mycena albidolilacea]